ncbi:MAG: site-specific integrase [Nitrospiraceae bacterium]
MTQGYAPQTILHYLKFLRHVLYAMIGKSKLMENPFERVTLPKVRPSRTRFLSSPEEMALCAKIGAHYAPWVRLAILTGLRKSEQFGLRWADVDLELGILTLMTTKNGGVQYVHLNDEAKRILRGLVAVAEAQAIANRMNRSPWVFPSENPETHLDVHNFYGRIFLPAVRQANLEDVTWHTLRHTFASRLAMNGASESTIAALLRHSGTSLVSRYAHLSPSHLKTAVEGVAAFGREKDSRPQSASEERQQAENSCPTVSETGTASSKQIEETREVVDSVGRGERI